MNDIDLTSAVDMYAVANTPLFLLRKLQRDPLTREIATSFSSDQILAALKSALEAEPSSAEEYVKPYVLLVALSQQPNDSGLRAAGAMPKTEKWDWYGYLQRVLLASFNPTTTFAIKAPSFQIGSGSVSRSQAPVERKIIVVNH